MVRLLRTRTSDEGTFGYLLAEGNYFHTGELPWRENRPNVSCIPEGKYKVSLRESPKYGTVYHVRNVQGRSYILFHQGNFCGDRAKGYRTNVQGCILLGLKAGKLWGQQAVLSSRLARAKFESLLMPASFDLEVKNVGFTV